MTQFQHSREHDRVDGQYSNNGSVTSPIVGTCSINGSLRRHDARMVVSPHNQADLHNVGGSPVDVIGQKPCSPMISFKPIISVSNQHPQTTSGILASPLPQPPNMFIKGRFQWGCLNFLHFMATDQHRSQIKNL